MTRHPNRATARLQPLPQDAPSYTLSRTPTIGHYNIKNATLLNSWSTCKEDHVATHYWTVLLNMEGRPEQRVHDTQRYPCLLPIILCVYTKNRYQGHRELRWQHWH